MIQAIVFLIFIIAAVGLISSFALAASKRPANRFHSRGDSWAAPHGNGTTDIDGILFPGEAVSTDNESGSSDSKDCGGDSFDNGGGSDFGGGGGGDSGGGCGSD